MRDLEEKPLSFIDSGDVGRWFRGTDECVRQVASTVNGPLLEHCASISGFKDRSAIEAFRTGAAVVGVLPVSGLGLPLPRVTTPDVRAGAISGHAERGAAAHR